MSARRSKATHRAHLASAYARKLVGAILVESAEWFRPAAEGPPGMVESMDEFLTSGNLDLVLQRCPHDGPETGATFFWPSFDTWRRCGECWRQEMRVITEFSTVTCTLCERPVAILVARHFLATADRFILVLSVCPTCLEPTPDRDAA